LRRRSAPIIIADHSWSFAHVTNAIEALDALSLVTNTFTRNGARKSFLKGYVYRFSSLAEVYRALAPVVICIARIGHGYDVSVPIARKLLTIPIELRRDRTNTNVELARPTDT
jgi:hypothetical protein